MTPLTIRRGDTLALAAIMKSDGAALDLTGAVVTAFLRADADGATELALAAAIPAPTAGAVRINAAPQQTSVFPEGAYRLYVRLTSATGQITTSNGVPTRVIS